MINRTTPEELIELGKTIIAASQRLEELLIDVSKQADAEFAAQSHAFIIEHAKTGENRRIRADYSRAHANAIAAGVAASNLRDLADRASTLRQKCAWWNMDGQRQVMAELKLICDQLPEWTAKFADAKPRS